MRAFRACLLLVALLLAARPAGAEGCAATDEGGPIVYEGDPSLKQVADRVQWVIYDPLLATDGLRLSAESDLHLGLMDLARNDIHTGYMTSIASGDFDEDGWVDLIAASDATRRITFFRNRTSENAAPDWYADPLTARTPRFAPCEPGSPQAACSTWVDDDLPLYAAVTTVAGDFDDDGHQDFVVAKICERCTYNERPCVRRMYMGNGNGTFDAPTTPFSDADIGYMDWTGTTLQALDWDGDGDLDLLAAAGTGGGGPDRDPEIRLLTNDGATPPTFAGTVLITGPTPSWRGTGTDADTSRRGFSSVTAGRFDGDDYVDLIVSGVGHDVMLYYPGRRNRTFGSPRDMSTGNASWPLSANVILGMPWDSRGLDLIAATDNWNFGCATTLCATDTT